jgi:hypothetical protein
VIRVLEEVAVEHNDAVLRRGLLTFVVAGSTSRRWTPA